MTPRERIALWVSLLVMALLLFGNEGFRHLVSQLTEKHRLEKSLVRLRAEHDTLARELALLEQNPAYTEYLIRKNLRYVKKGEVEYRLLKPTKREP